MQQACERNMHGSNCHKLKPKLRIGSSGWRPARVRRLSFFVTATCILNKKRGMWTRVISLTNSLIRIIRKKLYVVMDLTGGVMRGEAATTRWVSRRQSGGGRCGSLLRIFVLSSLLRLRFFRIGSSRSSSLPGTVSSHALIYQLEFDHIYRCCLRSAFLTTFPANLGREGTSVYCRQ
jgi:hypothetical protein